MAEASNDTDGANLANYIAELMLDKKALNVKIINVTEIASFTDYFVLCSSESDPQTQAVTDHIDDVLRKKGIRPSHIEGYQNLQWVLMDYYDVIACIFHTEMRSFYGFERLWADGETIEVKDDDDEAAADLKD